MNQETFEQTYGRANHVKDRQAQRKLSLQDVANRVFEFMPILKWLPRYSFRKDFHYDLVTGLTVGIMVVPQGMAYTTLAGVSPIYGLYSCFFSAFVYMFFGTSRHISVGTFAVASMMVGAFQSDLIADFQHQRETSNSTDLNFDFELTPIVVTTSLTFLVGICQLLMGFCRLSFLTSYISDPLVSGFTTGAAVHVLFSQLEKVLGVKIARQSGIGTIVKMFVELARALPHSNTWTLGISTFGIIFLSIGRDYLNPMFKARFRVPLPLELFLVIASIVFSRVFDITKAHGVKIVAHVPQGIPVPSLPKFELIPYLWQCSIPISVICFIFVFSMGKIFAKKHKYKLDANQELYALGISQIISSLFPVYPSGASLSRSSLCETTGARTQFHALFSSALLLVVILWIAPLLEHLPMAILACIVIVSLKNLFLQFGELPRLWRISKADFLIWLATFFSTTFIDVTIGLMVGVVVVIVSVVLREQWPKMKRLHTNSERTVFRPANEYAGLLATGFIPPYKAVILKFEAPLYFANSTKFVERCGEAFTELCAAPDAAIVPVSGVAIPLQTQKSDALAQSDSNGYTTKKESSRDDSSTQPSSPNKTSDDSPTKTKLANGYDSRPKKAHNYNLFLLLDMATVSFLDSVGVEALAEVFRDGQRFEVDVLYAELTDTNLRLLERCEFFKSVPKYNFYPTLRDAVLYIENMSIEAGYERGEKTSVHNI